MKQHPIYSDYYGTEEGEVFSTKRSLTVVISGYTLPNGYQKLNIFYNLKRLSIFRHRFIAETFISNSNNLPVINHIDGNIQNNTVSNLEWCTQAYNIHQAVKYGQIKSGCLSPHWGEKSRTHKLTWQDVNDIRALYPKRYNQQMLGLLFDISETQIGNIINFKCWKTASK